MAGEALLGEVSLLSKSFTSVGNRIIEIIERFVTLNGKRKEFPRLGKGLSYDPHHVLFHRITGALRG